MAVELEKYKEARKFVVKSGAKKGFLAHLCIYVVANILMAAYNLVVAPEKLWFYWPLICWGGGLVFHYVAGVALLDKWWEYEERDIAKILKK